MSNRRRDCASEEEPAKSNSGRTGAHPEDTNQTTPPGGSSHDCNRMEKSTSDDLSTAAVVR
ncbi:hypothetical protein T12_13957 [Trichinella patagoniensis]|uniref:Uncharacterized protein n=1 Tax=Trichinella patagoniensis TaxID=990121 RepID=A0A0V0YR37_9BILA|nr:hypothetical protein T12_13957 [Trichinella patagoniensis]